MSKFAGTAHTARGRGPLVTQPRTFERTHEGGVAYSKDPKTELFTLASVRFLGEDSFYESADIGTKRFVALVRQIATTDPEWLLKFIGWLRRDANIRTGAVVAAAEACGMRAKGARDMVMAACRRDDEPAEMLAYWMSNYGRTIPGVMKRGISDVVGNLYDEMTVVKYDSSKHSLRPGDVIELCHPKPASAKQATLFKYMLDVRHGRSDPRGLDELEALKEMNEWRARAAAGEGLFPLPQLATWETVSSYTDMNAGVWMNLIPHMGYMALLRNLRNFDEAGISHAFEELVTRKLADPDEVARSRQLPFRFWSAWKHSNTMSYGPAIEAAMEESCRNIPVLGGRSLVMVDQSGSMNAAMSGKSKLQRNEAACVFGGAFIRRNGGMLAVYDYARNAKPITYSRSVLRTIITAQEHTLGGGTETWPSVYRMWQEHGPFDRVLVFTDMQDHPGRLSQDMIPSRVPIYVWDLAGYQNANIEVGSNRYLLGGLSDSAFKLLNVLENFKPGQWPWDIAS